MELTREQILKHKDQIEKVLDEVTVKTHQARSKKGTVFTVKQHERRLEWGAEHAGMIQSAKGRYVIGKNADGGYELWRDEKDREHPLGKFKNIDRAKKYAEKHFAGKTLV